MKKLSILILCALLAITKSFCNVMPILDSSIEFEKNLALTSMMFSEEIKNDANDLCYREFLEKTIPYKFVTPFYEFTKNHKDLGIEIIGVGLYESGWRIFRGKVNNNGSVDLGPLMLNSFNTASEKFMNAFATEDTKVYEYDEDIFYMTICINYYFSLRSELDLSSALQVYNGGWRTQNKNCSQELKRTVTRYANKVFSYINETSKNWDEYKNEYLYECESRIKSYYISKIYESFNCIKNSLVTVKRPSGTRNYDVYCYSYIGSDKTYKNDEEYYKLFILMDWPNCDIVYKFHNGKIISREIVNVAV